MNKIFSWIGAAVALFAVSAASAQSGVIEDDFVGCLTDAYYDAYDFAVTIGNWNDRDQLMASSCYELEGLEYIIVKKTFMTARIQVTIDGEAIRLSTTRDAIR